MLCEVSDPLSILKLLQALVSGLDLLWRVRITHRDLKPDNILIRDDGSPVIIDLGIILAIEQTDLTYSFAPFSPCTPRYAAPEQLKNRRAEIDHRTDQFILGIDVMELIGGGVHPFDPSVLGCGNSIPENIINNKWTKEKLDCADFLSIKDLARIAAIPPKRKKSALFKKNFSKSTFSAVLAPPKIITKGFLGFFIA